MVFSCRLATALMFMGFRHMLEDCTVCGGFVPKGLNTCPNCDHPLAATKSRARKLAKAAGAAGMMVTLMACYGDPYGEPRPTEDEPRCGDGYVEGSEDCDDGNTKNGDGCSAQCRYESECGDNFVDSGEQCDDGNTNDGDGCSSDCQNEPVCGDYVVDSGEQCDDGNTNDGDGCSSDCQNESLCGNHVMNGGEQCDDGNQTPGDGCDEQCRLERCVLADPLELAANPGTAPTEGLFHVTCAGKNWSGPDAAYAFTPPGFGWLSLELTANAGALGMYVLGECATQGELYAVDQAGQASCAVPTGSVTTLQAAVSADPVWVVVDSDGLTTPSDFTLSASFELACGDGTMQEWAAEECDDGNTDSGDGCSEICQLEADAVCAAALPLVEGDNLGDTSAGAYYEVFDGADCHGPEVPFVFTAPSDGTLALIAGGEHDLSLQASTSCLDAIAQQNACLNLQGSGLPEVLSMYLPAGTQLWVMVDGVSATDAGPFTLNATFTPI